MEISVPNSPQELKSFLRQLDKIILGKALEWARECYKAILEEVDELVAEHRSDRLSIEHRRGVWYQTCLGPARRTRLWQAGR